MITPYDNIYVKYFNDFQKFNYYDYDIDCTVYHDLMKPFINDESVRLNLLSDEVYPCSVIDDCLFLYDFVIGMPYALKEGKAYCVHDCMVSAQHDILEVNRLRAQLNPSKYQNLSFNVLIKTDININSVIQKYGFSYKGYSNNILFNELPTFSVHSMNELKEIILKISSVVKTKLWYRGQTKEYTNSRNLTTTNVLGLPETYIETPSLIPSLGRVKENIGKDYIRWLEVFNIWIISQNKDSEFSTYRDRVSSFLMNLNKVTEYCKNNTGELPFEFEDILRGNEELYDAGTLCMQQYGMLTSMLDITDDLDVALYFTQAIMKNGTFNKIAPTDSRVLYVFVEMPNSVTSLNRYQLFNNFPWEVEMPQRLASQCCGLLLGSDMFHKNTYAHRIPAKIIIDDDNIVSTKDTKDIFPDIEHDSLYKVLNLAKPDLRGLYG